MAAVSLLKFRKKFVKFMSEKLCQNCEILRVNGMKIIAIARSTMGTFAKKVVMIRGQNCYCCEVSCVLRGSPAKWVRSHRTVSYLLHILIVFIDYLRKYGTTTHRLNPAFIIK
ncbi:uncharacterized protein LOC113464902 [Ceratina calcarata]|uniref:Uncharacterized protein LOC113464902 n=1 Tax=Ceratina calcarata TaxID=156304 RepID=A0AAJ7S9F7_9HYME|nr:uncharacterized protein LOC113464902 [Ceratina calcarata]